MNLNKKYNLGLLILFHLFLVAIVEWLFFQYVVIPIVQDNIKDIGDQFPHLDEKTLKDYGIPHNEAMLGAIYSAAQTLTNKNDVMSQFLASTSDIYQNNISPQIRNYIEEKKLKEEINNQDSKYKTHIKIFFIFALIICMLIFWFYIYGKSKGIEADWVELTLGNIIPIIMILSFEYYFVNNIVSQYKITSPSGFTYECLTSLYPPKNT